MSNRPHRQYTLRCHQKRRGRASAHSQLHQELHPTQPDGCPFLGESGSEHTVTDTDDEADPESYAVSYDPTADADERLMTTE